MDRQERRATDILFSKLSELNALLARLDERSDNLERQIKLNSEMTLKLSEQHAATMQTIVLLDERYNEHAKESAESTKKLNAMMLDYEKVKAKGGLALVIVSVVGIAVWQGALTWFKGSVTNE